MKGAGARPYASYLDERSCDESGALGFCYIIYAERA
jgi:hypothetical protein